MRVNHSGEVCAQALYRGQALTAQSVSVKKHMIKAAREENDHLQWCENRLEALDGRKSILNPAWYVGSFAIGAFAGILGDRPSLGFLAETERQVETHLDKHLELLPKDDLPSHKVIKQMKDDENRHATSKGLSDHVYEFQQPSLEQYRILKNSESLQQNCVR